MNDQRRSDIAEITQQLYLLRGWVEVLKREERENVRLDHRIKLASASISIQDALNTLEKI